MRFHDQRLRIFGIDGAKDVPGDAGVEELAVLRVDAELLHLPRRHAGNDLRFRSRHILRADQKIAVSANGRIYPGLPIKPRELRRPRCIKRTRRRLWAVLLLRHGRLLVSAERGEGENAEREAEGEAEGGHGRGEVVAIQVSSRVFQTKPPCH
jgi:hypothetical protein